MSAYEELVDWTASMIVAEYLGGNIYPTSDPLAKEKAKLILAGILRTLRTCDMEWEPRDLEAFRVMLNDTPLVPPGADSGG